MLITKYLGLAIQAGVSLFLSYEKLLIPLGCMLCFTGSTAFVAILFVDRFVTESRLAAGLADAVATLSKLAGLAGRSMSTRKVRVQCGLCAQYFLHFWKAPHEHCQPQRRR
jgi:hypothetical protein